MMKFEVTFLIGDTVLQSPPLPSRQAVIWNMRVSLIWFPAASKKSFQQADEVKVFWCKILVRFEQILRIRVLEKLSYKVR